MKRVDYAHSLGLYPPGYPEVDCAISVAWASGDDDSEGTLIWDTQPATEGVEDPYPAEENPWLGVVETKDAR